MSTATVEIPLKVFRKIEKVLEKLDKQAEPIDWITEEEACKLLGIRKTTMIKKVCVKEIKPECYTKGVGGIRFYNKQKLMGL